MFELTFILMTVAIVLLSTGFWLKGREAGRIEMQGNTTKTSK